MEEASSSALFTEFMAGVAAMESFQGSSGHMLSCFHRNLELFRSPVLQPSSVLDELLKKNKTARMSRYIEAGFRHPGSDKNKVEELNRSIRHLQDHVQKARTCLEGLEKILDAATALLVGYFDAESGSRGLFQEPNDKFEDETDEKYAGTNHVTTMAVIYSMLQADYEMQASIVEDLKLDMPLQRLQSYSTVWTLRPFVDEKVLQNAHRVIL